MMKARDIAISIGLLACICAAGAIAWTQSRHCEFETGTVELHIGWGGALIAGCPDGKPLPSSGIAPAAYPGPLRMGHGRL